MWRAEAARGGGVDGVCALLSLLSLSPWLFGLPGLRYAAGWCDGGACHQLQQLCLASSKRASCLPGVSQGCAQRVSLGVSQAEETTDFDFGLCWTLMTAPSGAFPTRTATQP